MQEAHVSDALTPARLRAVLAVAAAGSFSVAAREIGTSQSNVSRAVAAVEANLRTPVFDRSTRSVRLTDSGREFVERAAAVTAELDAAVRATRPDQRPTPRLVVASLTSVSEIHLSVAISALGGRIPRFRCIEGLQTRVEHAVVSGQAAVGIGDLSDTAPELTVGPLWRETFRVAVPSGHRLARRRRVRLEDLASEALVGFSREAELRTTLDRELAAARQLRAPDFVVDRYRTALSMVAAGLGVMVVPSIVVGAVPAGARVVELDQPDLHRTIGLLRRADGGRSPESAALLDRLVEAVARIDGVEVLAA